MIQDLNKQQQEIYDFKQNHTLEQTMQAFNKKAHQINYIIHKKNKIDSIPKECETFIPLNLLKQESEADFSDEEERIRVKINNIEIEVSIQNLRKIIGL